MNDHYLTEAYAIVRGAPIQPTILHLWALYDQLHPKPEEDPPCALSVPGTAD